MGHRRHRPRHRRLRLPVAAQLVVGRRPPRISQGAPAVGVRRRRGSNGYQVRLWKVELAQLAEDAGISITVCHFPPGTSKWNRVEHRLFAAISTNWRGPPLTSHEVVVNLIGATTTESGLTVHAELDPASYPTKVKVSKEQIAAVTARIEAHDFHGEWNYTLRPQRTEHLRLSSLRPPGSSRRAHAAQLAAYRECRLQR